MGLWKKKIDSTVALQLTGYTGSRKEVKEEKKNKLRVSSKLVIGKKTDDKSYSVLVCLHPLRKRKRERKQSERGL